MGIGRIKHWNDKKGYGFIQANDGGKDVFFHISTWQNGERPQINQMVIFEVNFKKLKRSALWVKPQRVSSTYRPSQPQEVLKKAGWLKKAAAAAMIAVGSLGATLTLWDKSASPETTQLQQVSQDAQINQTIYLIKQGGPFPYAKDGTVFQNREKRLPIKNQGYYHEYTVPTPGLSHRGARRIVTGGNPPVVYYYTADHYRTFRQLDVPQ